MYLAAYIPDFSLEALARTEPDLRTHAVAVVEGAPPTVTVVACNERARAADVEPGMTELQAQQRLRLSGETWQIRQRSFDRERTAQTALLDCAGALSPRIEATASDTIIADIAGLEPLFGSPSTIARNLARRASDAGLEVHVAVASNPDTAMHAARGYPGITIIPPRNEAERLGPLPLEVLLAPQNMQAKATRTGASALQQEMEMIDTLERWGIRTLRGLASLPEIAVVERLGQAGLQWHRFATGTARRELVPHESPLEFEEVCELEYPLDLLEPLAFLLARMLDQLCARLQSRALATHELRLRAQLDPEVTLDREGNSTTPLKLPEGLNGAPDVVERTIKLPVPMLNSKTFLKLLQLDLKANPPTAPILKLWLKAEPVRPKFDQRGLFLPLTPEPQKLEITLARLAGVTGGRGNVGSPELLETHRPDAFRMTRFAPPAPDHTDNDGVPPKHNPASALRRFRPPQPVSVQIINGRPGTIGPPRELANREQMARTVYGEVVWCAGPWRTSGEWWNQEAWEREEWDVAVDGGRWAVNCQPKESAVRSRESGIGPISTVHSPLLRLFKDLLAGTWFIEGEYD